MGEGLQTRLDDAGIEPFSSALQQPTSRERLLARIAHEQRHQPLGASKLGFATYETVQQRSGTLF